MGWSDIDEKISVHLYLITNCPWRLEYLIQCNQVNVAPSCAVVKRRNYARSNLPKFLDAGRSTALVR